MAAGVGLRIKRLQALIDHPGTGDGERAVAQRMLERALSKSGARPWTGVGDRAYGGRFHRGGRHVSLSQVVEMIYADITFAQAHSLLDRPADLAERSSIRDAPRDITYSVESPSDGRIVVTIVDVPLDWGWVDERGLLAASPALTSLADELVEIMERYNYTGTDIGKRFFAGVRADNVTLIW